MSAIPVKSIQDTQKKDQIFMKEALKDAKKAMERGEVPVGAVLVKDDRVIARGYNQMELLKDGTAHAEMICLTSGQEALNDWRLLDTTLYCTLEPCLMCAGAMYATRIKRLVWAAPDLRVGANGSWVNVFEKKHPMHSIEISKGIYQDQAACLMREFFEKIRNEKDR